MSATSSATWRDKYLQLLQQQEKSEKRIAAQADQIQRLLAGFVSIVDLADEPLIRRLRKYQQQPGLTRTDLDGLEQSIKAFANRQQQADKRYREAFKAIVANLLNSNASGLNKKALRGLQTTLSDTRYLHDVLPLMTHLAKCAEPALLVQPVRQSWLQRFLGQYHETDGNKQKTDSGSAGTGSAETAEASEQLQKGELAEDLILDEAPSLSESFNDNEYLSKSRSSSVAREVNDDGEAFRLIAPKVERVLSELIDRVEPQVCVVEKVTAARARLKKGLNPNELVPTLEEIRDLIFQAYIEADGHFRQYLQGLELQLGEIVKLLGGIAELEDREQAGSVLVQSIRKEGSSLTSVLASTEETAQVKQAVEGYLEAIFSALQRYESLGDQADSEYTSTHDLEADTALMQHHADSLADQLASLVSKIQTMEEDAKTTQAELALQREKALLDALTQLPNREAYNQRVYDEFLRWQRYQRPLTLAVCDIDKFKLINDTYGHQVGDRVLQVFSKALLKRLRAVDFLGRFGGEEFVVLLPETSANDAFPMLDKIRSALASLPFSFKGQPVQITLSIGITEFASADTPDRVFARADSALYAAKNQGRNQCVVLEPDVVDKID